MVQRTILYCNIRQLVDFSLPKIPADQEEMIKLVAFDWNGTLIADGQTVVDCCNIELKKAYGVKQNIDLKTYREIFDVPVNQFFLDLGLDSKLVGQNSKKAAEIFHQAYEKKVNKCRTRKNVKKILIWLQKNQIQSVIVSNHAAKRIKEQLYRLKIDNYINYIFGNDHFSIVYSTTGKEKMLIKHLAKNKIRPHEVLLIGDAVEDIKIGKEMGTITAALTNGHCSTTRLRATKPDYLINNLSEIEKILKLNA